MTRKIGNKKTFIMNLNESLTSFNLPEIMNSLEKMRHLKERSVGARLEQVLTLRQCIEGSRFKKGEKRYIENALMKSIMGLGIKVAVRGDEKTISTIRKYVKDNFTGYRRLDSFLVELFKASSIESFTLFVLDIIQRYDKEDKDYDRLLRMFFSEILKLGDKGLFYTFVDYTLKAITEKTLMSPVKKIVGFLYEKKLVEPFLIVLLERLYGLINLSEKERYKIVTAGTELLEIISDYSDKSLIFALLLAHTGGLFFALPEMKSVQRKIESRLSGEYSELVRLSMRNINRVVEKIQGLESEYQNRLAKEASDIHNYWEYKHQEKMRSYVETVCELYLRLLQVKFDAESQKIDKDTNLFKRVMISLKYIHGLLPHFGIALIGEQSQISKFDERIHSSLEYNIQGADVRVILPGFKYIGENEEPYVIKKAVVERIRK